MKCTGCESAHRAVGEVAVEDHRGEAGGIRGVHRGRQSPRRGHACNHKNKCGYNLFLHMQCSFWQEQTMCIAKLFSGRLYALLVVCLGHVKPVATTLGWKRSVT